MTDKVKQIQSRLSYKKIKMSRQNIKDLLTQYCVDPENPTELETVKLIEEVTLNKDNYIEESLDVNESNANNLTVQSLDVTSGNTYSEGKPAIENIYSEEQKASMVSHSANRMGLQLSQVEALTFAKQIPASLSSRVEILGAIFDRLEKFLDEEDLYISRRVSSIKDRLGENKAGEELKSISSTIQTSVDNASKVKEQLNIELREVQKKLFHTGSSSLV